jgi:sulfur-carrier protein
MIRVVLPFHLQQLANTGREVELQVDGLVTPQSILDALEVRYPVLRGTVRDQTTKERRAFIRFFACGQDLSLEPPDALLPEPVANGTERFMIVGAMAGG